jgi:hypothetical protein
MSTTALFVELIVIGFETALWLLFLALIFIPLPAIRTPCSETLGDFALLLTALLLSCVYTLGIIVDKAAKWTVEHSPLAGLFAFRQGSTTSPGGERYPVLIRWLQPGPPHVPRASESLRQYAFVIARNGEPMSDLLYGRSKVRILRASIFNVPMMILAAAGLGAFRLTAEGAPAARGLVILTGVIMALLSLRFINWTYCYNRLLYNRRLSLFFHAQAAEAYERAAR